MLCFGFVAYVGVLSACAIGLIVDSVVPVGGRVHWCR